MGQFNKITRTNTKHCDCHTEAQMGMHAKVGGVAVGVDSEKFQEIVDVELLLER